MVVGLLPTLLFWLIMVYGVLPASEDCLPPTSCEWVGLGWLVITAYAIGVVMLSSVTGLAIQLIYRKRVWKSDEVVKQTGKIPYLLLVGTLFVFAIYFLLSISGLLSKSSAPGVGPYP